MKLDKGFIGNYKMLDYRKVKKSVIRKSVRSKLENKKDEVIIMKMSKLKKLAIAGAIAATTAISFTAVNAATDGAVVEKITETINIVRFTINGKEVDVPAKVVKEGDNYVEVEIEVDDEVMSGEGFIEFEDENLDLIEDYEYDYENDVYKFSDAEVE